MSVLISIDFNGFNRKYACIKYQEIVYMYIHVYRSIYHYTLDHCMCITLLGLLGRHAKVSNRLAVFNRYFLYLLTVTFLQIFLLMFIV